MPIKEFLEQYQLYRRFATDPAGYPPNIVQLYKPNLHMYCERCDSEQTLSLDPQYAYSGKFDPREQPRGKTIAAFYKCTNCYEITRAFLIKIALDGTWMMKVGQYPQPIPDVGSSLARHLGDNLDNYRRGLACEAESFGIGAFAYYRRVLEDVLQSLLENIPDLMSGEEKPRYEEALTRTKASHVAEEKIRLVKDLLPATLKMDGVNPLGVLYDALSGGLHGQSDQECMETAVLVRESLSFLVTQVLKTKQEKKEFSDNMKKLLEKRSKPPK